MNSTPTQLRNGLSRRELFRYGGAAAVAAGSTIALPGCATSSNRAAAPPRRRDGGRPRNVVLLVCDGMSAGVPSVAEPFSRQTRGRGTVWHRMMSDPKMTHGLLATRSLNSLVTDSAAAATAWGSGSQVNNFALNVLPGPSGDAEVDGVKLMPLGRLLADKGLPTGLVTTDAIVGATPAGFAAQQANRRNYDAIARDYLDAGVEVLLGGGLAAFDPKQREDATDMVAEYRKRGYDHLAGRDQVRAARGGRKLLGLFAERTMPYTLDHRNSPQLRASTPTLAEMSRAALTALAADRDGFFLMIEAARVDHAAHNNDPAAILWDQIAFDDAVEAVMDFAEDRGDTLVIVTSDHGNANFALNGTGSRYAHTNEHFVRIADATASFDLIPGMIKQAARGGDPVAATQRVIRQATGAPCDARYARQIHALVNRAPDTLVGEEGYRDVFNQHQNWNGILGQVVGNHTGTGWSGVSHTADHVILTATGPGSGALAGLRHHTALHDVLADAFGIKHTNPTREAVVPA